MVIFSRFVQKTCCVVDFCDASSLKQFDPQFHFSTGCVTPDSVKKLSFDSIWIQTEMLGPSGTTISNAEQGLREYWNSESKFLPSIQLSAETKEPEPLNPNVKFHQKYLSEECPYRQEFVRTKAKPAEEDERFLASKRKPLAIKPVTTAEYRRLSKKSKTESKTSPRFPGSPSFNTNGEVVIKRWPENKLKIVKNPLPSPNETLPLLSNNCYNNGCESQPHEGTNNRLLLSPKKGQSPSRKSPKSRKNRCQDPDFSKLIDSLNLTVSEDELQAIKYIQNALLQATIEFDSTDEHQQPVDNCHQTVEMRDHQMSSIIDNNNNCIISSTGTKPVNQNLFQTFNSAAVNTNDTVTNANQSGGKLRHKSAQNIRTPTNNSIPATNRTVNRPKSHQNAQYIDYSGSNMPTIDSSPKRQPSPPREPLSNRHQNRPQSHNNVAQNTHYSASTNTTGTAIVSTKKPGSAQYNTRSATHHERDSEYMKSKAYTRNQAAAEELKRLYKLQENADKLSFPERRLLKLQIQYQTQEFETNKLLNYQKSKRAGSAGRYLAPQMIGRKKEFDLYTGTKHDTSPPPHQQQQQSHPLQTRDLVVINSPRAAPNSARMTPRELKQARNQPAEAHQNHVNNPSKPTAIQFKSSDNHIKQRTKTTISDPKSRVSKIPFSSSTDGTEQQPHKKSVLDLIRKEHDIGTGSSNSSLHSATSHDDDDDLNPFKVKRQATTTNSSVARLDSQSGSILAISNVAHSSIQLDTNTNSADQQLHSLYIGRCDTVDVNDAVANVLSQMQSLNTGAAQTPNNPAMIAARPVMNSDDATSQHVPTSHDTTEPVPADASRPKTPTPMTLLGSMNNLFSEMKSKASSMLRKRPLSGDKKNTATITSAHQKELAEKEATKSAADIAAEEAKLTKEHLQIYNNFVFDIAKLDIEFIDHQNIAVKKTLGRGKFAAVYEAQLKKPVLSTLNSGLSSSGRSLSQMNLLAALASQNGSSPTNKQQHDLEPIAVKVAQYENNDPFNATLQQQQQLQHQLQHQGDIHQTSELQHATTAAVIAVTKDSHKAQLPPLSCIHEYHRELKALKELAGHGNIVTIRGVSLAPLCIMLELVPGGNLYGNMENPQWQASTSLSARIVLFQGISSGLAHMHNSLYIHRDIKAHNILVEYKLSGESVAKIADLGTAVKLKSKYALLYEPVGTSGYTAPEVFSSDGYSFPADVFSSVVLLWEILGKTKKHRDNCLTGLEPSVAVQMMESGKRPTFHNDAYHSNELQEIINSGWATRAEERPTIEEMRTILSNFQ